MLSHIMEKISEHQVSRPLAAKLRFLHYRPLSKRKLASAKCQ